MKDNIKKAFESAEQEIQDKEVAKFKDIVLKLLNKKKSLDERKAEIEKDIKVIRTTIDDFKAGRLDKIKEMLEKNEQARDLVPLQITIIQNDIFNNYPLQPWRWNYNLNWNYYPTITGSLTATTAGSNQLAYYSIGNSGGGGGSANITNAVYTCLSGTTASNFTGGTYDLGNGQTINL